MGKWSKEFSRQLFGDSKKRETSGQRYIRRSGNRTRRQQARNVRRAKSLFNKYK